MELSIHVDVAKNRTRTITHTEHCNALGHRILSVGRKYQIEHTCLKQSHLIVALAELNY